MHTLLLCVDGTKFGDVTEKKQFTTLICKAADNTDSALCLLAPTIRMTAYAMHASPIETKNIFLSSIKSTKIFKQTKTY